MRALQVLVPIGPDGLALRDITPPEPATGEVLIKVGASSVNRLDHAVMNRRGIARPVALPRTLGIGPVGRVVALGPEADPGLLGVRVVAKPNIFCGWCARCRSGSQADCPAQWVLGVHRDGGSAEYVTVPARAAIRAPSGISDAVLTAAVHCVPVALHMIRRVGDIQGARVLVIGARGAVGSASIQLARHSGAARVTGLDRTIPGQWYGADVATSLDGTGPGEAFDVVVDTTGDGDLFGAAIGLLAWGGRAVTCAAIPASALTIDMARLYQQRLQLHGASAADLHDVRDGLAMVADGRVHIAAPLELPLDAYRNAYAFPIRQRKTVFRLE